MLCCNCVQIGETQQLLVKARQDELRSSANSLGAAAGAEVQRWMALKSIAEARSMLQTLFRSAAQQKAQVGRQSLPQQHTLGFMFGEVPSLAIMTS